MTFERFNDAINRSIVSGGHRRDVGVAAIRDFLRGLHEVMTKAGRDQMNLLSQVQTVLGVASMCHLAAVLHASSHEIQSFPEGERCPLADLVAQISRERGLEVEAGKRLLCWALKALDEQRSDANGNVHSATITTYWTLGDEAAYHLGGLFVGDDLGIVETEFAYFDPRVKRFCKLVDTWNMELASQQEDSE